MKRLTIVATWMVLAALCVPVLAWAASPFVTLDGSVPAGWDVKWGTSKDPRFRHLVVKLNEKVDGIDSVVGNVGAIHDQGVQWKTRDAFVEAFDPSAEAARDAQLMASPPTSEPPATLTKLEGAVINDTVKIGGVEFWHIAYPASGYYVDYIKAPGASQASAQWVKVEETWQEFYYAPLPDGTAVQLMISATTDAKHLDRLPSLKAEAQQILGQMRFDFTGNGVTAGNGPEQPAAPATLPWRSVSGGIAAVAAAAIALVGAASSSASKGSKPDPRKPIGYVLQLSARELAVASKRSASFEATAWRVMGSGALEPATDVTVSLSPPFGIDAQPASGAGSVKSLVWQIGEPAVGAPLRVSAVGGAGGTSADVVLQTEAATCLRVTLLPAGRGPLMPDGKDSLLVSASVQLAPRAAADPTIDAEAVRRSISFVAPNQSDWLNVGTERDEPGGKSLPVSASNPDTRQTPNPPASVSLTVTALVGTEQLSQSVNIPVAQPPVLDARPDVLQFSAGSKQAANVAVSVEPPGESEWEFRCERRECDRALVETDVRRLSPSSATLTVTEAVGDQPPSDRPSETVELWVVAESSTAEPLRRRVQVTIAREGVYIDGLGRDADGTFHIAADGSGEPTDIDVRVFVRDEAGRIGFDPRLSQSLTVEAEHDGNGPGPIAYAEVVREPAGIRPSNSPSAIHRFHTDKVLPTEGKPVAARYLFRVDRRDEPQFSATVPVSLIGVNMAPYSPAWDVEYERCKQIIERYVPTADQGRLLTMLAERGHTMGAEGLFELRKKIWSFAETRMRQEINAQLDKAWEYQQIEDFLDWVSWCGDIAIGVASGSLVGTSASIAVGALKPVLVSAMTAWVNGRGIDEWAAEQVGIVLGAVEGAATDIDLLKKLTGGKAALAWSAYLSYYFVKELINDPNRSVVEAMKNVARMVRDEALISFLRGHAGTSIHGKPHPDAEPGVTKPRPDGAPEQPKVRPEVDPKPRTPRPDTPTPPRPDAPPLPVVPHPDAPDAPAPKPHDAPPADAPETHDAPPTEPEPKPEPPVEKPPADAPSSDRPPADKPAEPPVKPDGADKPPADKPPADKPPVGPPVSMPPPSQPMTGRQAAALVRASMHSEGGVNKVDRVTVERIMTDPDAAREMRKTDPEAYKAYDNTRQEMRAEHDKKLADYAGALPGLTDKNVRVETVGTEGGIDRDFRVLVEVPDPREPGKSMWLEVPKERWQDQSNRIFADQTGGPKDVEGARKWAADHQQLGTDKFHGEASIDMSDQAWRVNPETGQREAVRVPSRLSEVEAGKGKLLDPEGLGKTYQTKVAESSQAGKLDGYTQAKKAFDTLEAVRDGYSSQDFKVGELDPKLKSSMSIVRQVAEGKLTPAQGDSLLKGGGMGDLSTVMEKVSSQFASLKWAK